MKIDSFTHHSPFNTSRQRAQLLGISLLVMHGWGAATDLSSTCSNTTTNDEHLEETFIVLDALDECIDAMELLNGLEEIHG